MGMSKSHSSDGRLISLPIPLKDKTRYSELRINEKLSYYDLMRSLKSDFKIRLDKRISELTKDTVCHLDPDIYKTALLRSDGWKPSFGQIDQAQTHLKNEGVKEGDLFLFFGWFRKTREKDGKIIFDASAPICRRSLAIFKWERSCKRRRTQIFLSG